MNCACLYGGEGKCIFNACAVFLLLLFLGSPPSDDLSVLLQKDAGTYNCQTTFTAFLNVFMMKYRVNYETEKCSVCFFVSSVYNACGLASYDLFDEVDFDQWFTNQLVNELNNPSSRYVA